MSYQSTKDISIIVDITNMGTNTTFGRCNRMVDGLNMRYMHSHQTLRIIDTQTGTLFTQRRPDRFARWGPAEHFVDYDGHTDQRQKLTDLIHTIDQENA